MRTTIAAALCVALAALLAPAVAASAAAGLRVSTSHAPSHFLPGMVAAYITVTVWNPGRVSVGGTVTVTDTLPAGLTPTAAAGDGWTCSGTTCSRNDPLAPRSAYPPIRIVLNVAVDGGGLPSCPRRGEGAGTTQCRIG